MGVLFSVPEKQVFGVVRDGGEAVLYIVFVDVEAPAVVEAVAAVSAHYMA